MTTPPTGPLTAAEMPELVALLREWVPQQRWYAAKGKDLTSLVVEDLTVLSDWEGVLTLDLVVATDHGDDTPVRYQVPLVVRQESVEALAFAAVGEVPQGFVYDGLSDADGRAAWLRALLTGSDTGDLSFRHDSGELTKHLPSRLVGVEQSNTSVVYGDDAILKVFRRLAPGPNPDLEVTGALVRAGSPHVPPLLGHVEGPVEGTPTTLAVLQQFLPNATDGWRLATTSVRDLFAEGDLHADEVGGDFASESERLGRVTAEVHRSLAQALPSELEPPSGTQATVRRMNARLDAVLREVPELGEFETALRTAYEEWSAWPDPVPVQRIHGDLHLGQVLRTETGWHLLDFEGEPARPLSERRELMTPNRDVAGMLRSFDYASYSLLADQPSDHSLQYRAEEWAQRNRSAFCDGYAEAAGRDPRDDGPVLRGCELDKAVYEVHYEARHRPSWLPIPLAGIRRLLAPIGDKR